MANSILPTPEQLRELLIYAPETGKLYWKERPIEMFRDGYFTRETNCRRWNVRYAGKEAFICKNGNGYKHGTLMRSNHQGHRVAWCIYYGEWPQIFIDHIDGIKTNNAIGNLRQASNGQNMQNTKRMSSNRSGVKGVCWDDESKRWKVQISASNRRYHIGRFLSIEDAILARRKAAEDLHNEFVNHGH